MKYIWFKSNGEYVVMDWREFHNLITKHRNRKYKFAFCGIKNVEFAKTWYDKHFEYETYWLHSDKHIKVALEIMKD